MSNGSNDNGDKPRVRLAYFVRNGYVFIAGILIGTLIGYLITHGLMVTRQLPKYDIQSIAEKCKQQCQSGGQLGVDIQCQGNCMREAITLFCADYNEWARANNEPLMDCPE